MELFVPADVTVKGQLVRVAKQLKMTMTNITRLGIGTRACCNIMECQNLHATNARNGIAVDADMILNHLISASVVRSFGVKSVILSIIAKDQSVHLGSHHLARVVVLSILGK